MDILTYINRMNQIYGNGQQAAPVYNTQQYLQGGRVGYKPGGIVEPGVTHYGQYYDVDIDKLNNYGQRDGLLKRLQLN